MTTERDLADLAVRRLRARLHDEEPTDDEYEIFRIARTLGIGTGEAPRLSAPKFRPGQVVRHKASGETGVVEWVDRCPNKSDTHGHRYGLSVKLAAEEVVTEFEIMLEAVE